MIKNVVQIVLSEETRQIAITNDNSESERLLKNGWIILHEPFMFDSALEVWVFYKPILDKLVVPYRLAKPS